MANPLISMGLGLIPAYFGRIIKYDDDGNMISVYINGKDELLSYDIKNRLTSCGETLYTYDAEGNRIKVTEGSEETRLGKQQQCHHVSRVLLFKNYIK